MYNTGRDVVKIALLNITAGILNYTMPLEKHWDNLFIYPTYEQFFCPSNPLSGKQPEAIVQRWFLGLG